MNLNRGPGHEADLRAVIRQQCLNDMPRLQLHNNLHGIAQIYPTLNHAANPIVARMRSNRFEFYPFRTDRDFAQAHHLVSAVTSRLRPEFDAFDLLAATLPGGSITGAPKRRAMQIIDELELGPRGAYCGALAWIGFDGAMDSAIIIRTITASADTLYAQAGGGITWDSKAPAEYGEAMLKISPLLKVHC
jgi:chorismate binding enzyme